VVRWIGAVDWCGGLVRWIGTVILLAFSPRS
jgi:hypothetical protein